MNNYQLDPWEVISSRTVLKAKPWIEVTIQQVRLPDGKMVDDYHQIAITDYVIIYAETGEGLVIIERQYKHGVGKVSLTLPAGGILEGEAPLAAAKRELLEETGYAADAWQELGTFVVDGNYGCGEAHLFKAKGVRAVAEPDSGDLEDIEILLKKPRELFESILSGEIALLGSATAVALATNPLLSDPPFNGRGIELEGRPAD